MDMPMAEPEFLRYADAQAAYGRHLLAEHQRDGTGCCRSCGRAHPCEQRAHGGRLVVHYADWDGGGPALVRPYLRTAG
ncbi:hypothetical protein [Catellatospora sp. IY07-71]|uniref:hypothetical protein n=1 Tax=Catellatospora sp. IY07-71 TaxID=2728827 RepID=UPI001BB34961|nr:hypothetical protein [Catellatospora sp. IY07-71]